MNNLSTSDIKNIKEKLVNNNNRIKKDRKECKGVKYIWYLFNEVKNKKANLYKTEKIKNIKDLNEHKGIKDIRYFFNDNIYEHIIDIV